MSSPSRAAIAAFVRKAGMSVLLMSIMSPGPGARAAPTAGEGSQAAEADPCTKPYLCLYTRTHYHGQLTLSDTVKSGQCVAVDLYNAGVGSADNRSRQYARFWGNSDCTGRNYLLKPGHGTVNFGFLARGLGGR